MQQNILKDKLHILKNIFHKYFSFDRDYVQWHTYFCSGSFYVDSTWQLHTISFLSKITSTDLVGEK